jgi:hypothetical protein
MRTPASSSRMRTLGFALTVDPGPTITRLTADAVYVLGHADTYLGGTPGTIARPDYCDIHRHDAANYDGLRVTAYVEDQHRPTLFHQFHCPYGIQLDRAEAMAAVLRTLATALDSTRDSAPLPAAEGVSAYLSRVAAALGATFLTYHPKPDAPCKRAPIARISPIVNQLLPHLTAAS